jgi:hypothetical protein
VLLIALQTLTKLEQHAAFCMARIGKIQVMKMMMMIVMMVMMVIMMMIMMMVMMLKHPDYNRFHPSTSPAL